MGSIVVGVVLVAAGVVLNSAFGPAAAVLPVTGGIIFIILGGVGVAQGLSRQGHGRRVVLAIGGAVGLFAVWLGHLALQDNDFPSTVDRYQLMCTKPQGFEEAAARSGVPPRPISAGPYFQLLAGADQRVWLPEDPATVQLVACVRPAGRGEPVGKCTYTSPDGKSVATYNVTFLRGTYAISVYEARSGRLLGTTAVLRGGGSEAVNCLRHRFVSRKEREITEATRLSDRQLHDALSPYVLK